MTQVLTTQLVNLHSRKSALETHARLEEKHTKKNHFPKCKGFAKDFGQAESNGQFAKEGLRVRPVEETLGEPFAAPALLKRVLSGKDSEGRGAVEGLVQFRQENFGTVIQTGIES